MSNGPGQNKNLFGYLILIISLGTIFFFIYTLQYKKADLIKAAGMEADIAGLNGQLHILDRKLSATTDLRYSNTMQIYNLITESAGYSQVALKSFVADKKAADLEIALIGNFPKIIIFFKYLRQAEFNSIKTIEIKNNSQDPEESIEVLLKVNVPTAKGVK